MSVVLKPNTLRLEHRPGRTGRPLTRAGLRAAEDGKRRSNTYMVVAGRRQGAARSVPQEYLRKRAVKSSPRRSSAKTSA
jgi:hypothetical protein